MKKKQLVKTPKLKYNSFKLFLKNNLRKKILSGFDAPFSIFILVIEFTSSDFFSIATGVSIFLRSYCVFGKSPYLGKLSRQISSTAYLFFFDSYYITLLFLDFLTRLKLSFFVKYCIGLTNGGKVDVIPPFNLLQLNGVSSLITNSKDSSYFLTSLLLIILNNSLRPLLVFLFSKSEHSIISSSKDLSSNDDNIKSTL